MAARLRRGTTPASIVTFAVYRWRGLQRYIELVLNLSSSSNFQVWDVGPNTATILKPFLPNPLPTRPSFSYVETFY